jgi:hypothetical protein
MAVNLSPVGGVAAQFFDNAGNVLTGGKLQTYLAGTTTPQPAYTSSSGITAWSNPIILDAAGRVSGSGEIWITDGVQYKFMLRDSNDVLIATYDNINGINSNFVAFTNQQEIQTATAGQTVFNLTTMQYQPATNSLTVFVDGVNQYGPGAQYAYVETDIDTVTFVNGLHVGAEVKFTTSQLNSSGIGACSVSYEPPFTNSSTRPVCDKLAENISVEDFGADPTSAVNSTTAFTNAGSALAKSEVNITPGSFLLNSDPAPTGNPTWVLQNGASITGAGNLLGNAVSRSIDYTPSWVTNSYDNAWGYMPPNSVQTNYVKSGNLAFTAMAEVTGNQAVGSATIGFSSAIENKNTGFGASWCYYGTTLGNTNNLTAATHCVEYDISAASTNVGTTIGIAMNAGGEAANMPGMGYTFQSVGVALQIAVNNAGNYANVNFVRGLYITDNAIEPTFNTAINLSQNHSIRWTGVGFSQLSSIQSTVTNTADATSIAFNDFGFFVNNAGNYPLFQLNNGTSTSATNYFLIDAATTGNAPTINAIGVDTDVDLKLFPKGTGCVDIASTGVSPTAGSLAGYLPIKINGTTFKIPYYNV